jgi:hypothetical protein
MASPVQPKAVVLYAKIGSVYYPIACAKDVSLTTTADFLELAPRSSNVWREFEYGRLQGEISGSGVTKINTDPDNLYTVFDVIGQQFSLLKFLVKFSSYDPEGNYKVFECNVLVEECNIVGSASALSSHTFKFKISGPVTITTTPVENTNPQILVYEYEASGAVSSLVIEEISAEATLIIVYIDTDLTGGVSQKILLAPDGYGAGEVQWDADTQTLSFGTALASGDRIKVIYVDPLSVESAFALEDGSGNIIQDGSGNEIITE